MSKRGTSFALRVTSLAIAGALGMSGLAACDPGPTPQAPIRVNFAPEGCVFPKTSRSLASTTMITRGAIALP